MREQDVGHLTFLAAGGSAPSALNMKELSAPPQVAVVILDNRTVALLVGCAAEERLTARYYPKITHAEQDFWSWLLYAVVSRAWPLFTDVSLSFALGWLFCVPWVAGAFCVFSRSPCARAGGIASIVMTALAIVGMVVMLAVGMRHWMYNH